MVVTPLGRVLPRYPSHIGPRFASWTCSKVFLRSLSVKRFLLIHMPANAVCAKDPLTPFPQTSQAHARAKCPKRERCCQTKALLRSVVSLKMTHFLSASCWCHTPSVRCQACYSCVYPLWLGAREPLPSLLFSFPLLSFSLSYNQPHTDMHKTPFPPLLNTLSAQLSVTNIGLLLHD